MCDKATIEFVEEMMEASASVGLLLHAAIALYMTVKYLSHDFESFRS